MTFDAAGNLYGTTANGGETSSDAGTVFELSQNSDGTWQEKQLHIFNGASDGAFPTGGLIMDASGNLYGTTYSGSGPTFYGVVFKLSPNSNGTWTERILYTFTGGADGASPGGNLLFDADGNLYGEANSGGDIVCHCGVVFELKPSASGAWTESVLYAFKGGLVDGANPGTSLTFDSAGNLYGTTPGPWLSNSMAGGTVFKLTPSASGNWNETILHFFGVEQGDGIEPEGGVLLDPQGRLFGTTLGGPGNNYGGTIFEITP